MGRLVFFRVYSGKVVAGSYVYNPRSGKRERISRLFQMNSKQEIPMESIDAGDIGAGVVSRISVQVIHSVMRITQSYWSL